MQWLYFEQGTEGLKKKLFFKIYLFQNLHNCFEDKITVMVPDFSVYIVRKFLKLFYTGSVNLSNPWELEDIKEFGCKELGLSMGLDQLKFTKYSPDETVGYTSFSSPRSSIVSSSSNDKPDTPSPIMPILEKMPILETMPLSNYSAKRYKPKPRKFLKPRADTQTQPEIAAQKPVKPQADTQTQPEIAAQKSDNNFPESSDEQVRLKLILTSFELGAVHNVNILERLSIPPVAVVSNEVRLVLFWLAVMMTHPYT